MINRTLIAVTQLIAIFLCFQSVANAGVYKWEDDNGQIHYSDQPNQPGAEKFAIRKNTTTKPRTANNDKNSGETAAEEGGSEEAGAKEPGSNESQADEPKLVEVEPSKKEKRRLCNEAKSQITSISSRGRMREINKKGEYIYLSEKQRQQRLSAAKKQQREFCR